MIWLVVVAIVLFAACLYLLLTSRRQAAQFAADLRSRDEAGERLAAHASNYQRKLSALSESSGAGVLILDRAGKILEANRAADTILGKNVQELIGHNLLQATLSAEIQELATRSIERGQAFTQDFHLGAAPGRVIRVSAYPLPVGLSGVPETLILLVDITELHRLENVRRDFVANVSHELRTPLASIRAMAETLHQGALEDPEVAGPFLETIIREADRLGRISHDLLILSDAESKEPVKAWFDLVSLLREVVNRSHQYAEQAGLTLDLRHPPKLSLFASKDQIEQVLVNLIDNAIKYTKPGGKICVEASHEGGVTVIAVSDTGIGIMQQDQPRLFERFYRVDKARSRDSGGTGLGLAIVKHIVEAHGGEVKVDSEFNHGSTFRVSLPNPEETTS